MSYKFDYASKDSMTNAIIIEDLRKNIIKEIKEFRMIIKNPKLIGELKATRFSILLNRINKFDVINCEISLKSLIAYLTEKYEIKDEELK